MVNEKEILKVSQSLLAFAEKRRRKKLGVSVSPIGSIRIYRYEPSLPGCAEFQTTFEEDIACTCISARSNLIYGPSTQWRIRRLTPYENFQLMGVYGVHLQRLNIMPIGAAKKTFISGNSIVVDVLENIFRKLFIDKENENEQGSLF